MKAIRFFMVVMGVVFSASALSQNVNRIGDTFNIVLNEQSINAVKLDVYKTKFDYKGENGEIYDIYISALGECMYFKNVGGHSARKRLPSEIEREVQKEYSIIPGTKKYWCIIMSDTEGNLYSFKIKGAFTKNTICDADNKPTNFFVDLISVYHESLKSSTNNLKVLFIDTFDNIKEL